MLSWQEQQQETRLARRREKRAQAEREAAEVAEALDALGPGVVLKDIFHSSREREGERVHKARVIVMYGTKRRSLEGWGETPHVALMNAIGGGFQLSLIDEAPGENFPF